MADLRSFCVAVSQNGSKCGLVADSSGYCSHHQQLNRLLALANTSKKTQHLKPTSSADTNNGVSANSSCSPTSTLRSFFLPGETVLSTIECFFDFPRGYNMSAIKGALKVTNYRLFFAPTHPNSSCLEQPIVKSALCGIPTACISKVGYPQETGSNTDGVPTHVVITFKNLTMWHLRCNIHNMMIMLNSKVFVDSPVSLFAFARGNKLLDDAVNIAGHKIYSLEVDLNRMGLDLNSGPFRITRANQDYLLCPTYPPHFAVPAALTDHEVKAVAEFRSKGRMPVLCWVHQNTASMWRCAQPKRGLLNSSNSNDSRMLARIGQTNRRNSKIWIVDCRPELNARVNNLTGGGTESSSIPHASVSFMNIANIHAMRESIHAVRSLLTSLSTQNDLLWHARVEDTKWLYHIRLVLTAVLKSASAIHNDGQSVVVHCSDGWDSTGQVCALTQMLLDSHYRTLDGFMEVIEKEWIMIGHKFHDRVGPGLSESEEQSPVFLQFLDCVWQLLNQFPTYFEFNSYALEYIADSLFSARFGTFLCNCDRERNAINLHARTPSLWAFMKVNRSTFVNPFYRVPLNHHQEVLLPSLSAVLRQVVLWSEYYSRWCIIPSYPSGSNIPPSNAPPDWSTSSTKHGDLDDSMKILQGRIESLEQQLKSRIQGSPISILSRNDIPPDVVEEIKAEARAHVIKEIGGSPPAPAIPAPIIDLGLMQESASTQPQEMTMPLEQSSISSFAADIGSFDLKAIIAAAPKPKMALYAPPDGHWRCGICTKINTNSETKCIVCGRSQPVDAS